MSNKLRALCIGVCVWLGHCSCVAPPSARLFLGSRPPQSRLNLSPASGTTRRDDPDAKAHIYAFLQTWEANHVSQRLNEAEAERSKIAEFGMTLEGQATQWPSKHLPGSIDTFEELKTRCLRFFHRQVDQREIVGQFYTTRQDPIETIQQFVIRFQEMHSQLTRAPPEEEAKAVFLAALREPLRTMCAVIDFQTSTVD